MAKKFIVLPSPGDPAQKLVFTNDTHLCIYISIKFLHEGASELFNEMEKLEI